MLNALFKALCKLGYQLKAGHPVILICYCRVGIAHQST
jgi:hypothetical protein